MNNFKDQWCTVPTQGSPLFEAQICDQTLRQWVEVNAKNIDEYNAWALQRDPYSQRVRLWREKSV